jgi:hypothetical protein
MKKTIVVPNNFTPRPYQELVLKAFDSGIRNIDLVAHRRSGKDKVSFAILAREMVKVVGGYYYIFPQFNQGRKALWDNIDNDGFRLLHHIPTELWKEVNNTEMKLTLKNGSYFQVVGSDDVDNLVGTNPRGIVYSEYSLQRPAVYGYLSPIIKSNGGWQIFNYTPRGQNHAYNFHQMAQNNPEFASFVFTVEDTNLFTPEQLEAIKQEYIQLYGTDALFYQEYYCSFERPVLGSYYGSLLQQAELEGRINDKIDYLPSYGVYTAWDLGVNDTTAIWFFQQVGRTYRFIDYYENFGAGLEHYVEVLRKKEYDYINHYLPHDAKTRIQAKDAVAVSRYEILKQLGLQNMTLVPKVGVIDGIQKVRQVLPLCFFNSKKCERGLDCLREYRQQYSEKNRAFASFPVHDWASNGADAFRYFAVGHCGNQTGYDEVFKDPNKEMRKNIDPDLWYW